MLKLPVLVVAAVASQCEPADRVAITELSAVVTTAQGCNADGTEWVEWIVTPTGDGDWVVTSMYGPDYYNGPIAGPVVIRHEGVVNNDAHWTKLLYWGRPDNPWQYEARSDVEPLRNC